MDIPFIYKRLKSENNPLQLLHLLVLVVVLVIGISFVMVQ